MTRHHHRGTNLEFSSRYRTALCPLGQSFGGSLRHRSRSSSFQRPGWRVGGTEPATQVAEMIIFSFLYFTLVSLFIAGWFNDRKLNHSVHRRLLRSLVPYSLSHFLFAAFLFAFLKIWFCEWIASKYQGLDLRRFTRWKGTFSRGMKFKRIGGRSRLLSNALSFQTFMLRNQGYLTLPQTFMR